MRPTQRSTSQYEQPFHTTEGSRRLIYQAFREGRVTDDEATAELLAINLVERQATSAQRPSTRVHMLA